MSATDPAGKMIVYDRFLAELKRACRKAGVPEITCHELRHSCTELWIEKGASGEDIRRLLNHRTLSVTQTYIHRSDSRLKRLAEAL